ncbi:TlpA family protein disulfide reductase [Solitalea sp. MAHUQ-68]|uniref:TlpA family protein disulfide reductase n=1 Tax=Solitalea agri TaxID=2953739 RepID=A0A9X2F0N1_9SPHI|nr:TlpA disulfide reductase family protein [Solitalea agri]MCO4291890.1 TlpA family protein disulfide reductase [Solitalea agri]
MKKLLVFAAFLQFSALAVNAQITGSTISCKVIGSNDKTVVSLFQVKNGEAVKVASTKPDQNKIAFFKVAEQKEGTYFVVPAPSHGAIYRNAIYLKKGDQIKLTGYIGTSMTMDFDSCKLDKSNLETQRLNKWLVKFADFSTARWKEKDSFNFYTEYGKLETFATDLTKVKTPNNQYNAFLKDWINTDLHFLKAGNFFYFNISVKKLSYDSSAVVQPFYKSLNDTKILTTTAAFNSTRGFDMMKYVLSYWVYQKKLKPESPFDNTGMIANDNLKAFYLAKFFERINTYEEFAKYVMPYKETFTNPDLKDSYNQKYNALTKYAKGAPGLNFSFNDVNEKTYTLKDFKGKVVVIDLWATWCIPCRREKPTFMKIEEEYHGRNDIVFIGISQNQIKEKESWKKFVKENAYNGLELLDYQNQFTDFYNLAGIPRYMIFDRNGNVFTVDAPRPTTPEFKKTIEQALALGK